MKPRIFSWIILLATLTGCTKYLDTKPNKALVVPTTLGDAFALLNDYALSVNRPSLAFIASDDFYVSDSYVGVASANDRDVYLWETDAANTVVTIWGNSYSSILKVNTALQVLESVSPTVAEEALHKAYLGKAYFIRAWNHFIIALLFAQPYKSDQADKLPGIPLKLSPSIDEPVVRGTLAATYKQLLADINRAIPLLPVNRQPDYLIDRSAALLLKAHIALHMHMYDTALAASTAALQIRPQLINYNSLNPNASMPFARFNEEVLFQSTISGSGMQALNNYRIDSNLIKTYDNNDLRSVLFFKPNSNGSFAFKGDYGGVGEIDVFCGLSNNDTYLIKAECEARKGNTAAALQALNALLINRWKTGTFIPYTAQTAKEALDIILLERRKELVGRHDRWYDVRRLNAGENAMITLTRNYNDKTYTLPPNDFHYTFLIPQTVINFSGMEQNPR